MGVIHNVSINAASSGANTIYAGATGLRIRVLGYVIVAAGAVTATWKSGSTGLTGAMSLITGVPAVAPMVANRDYGHLVTAAGDDLVLTLSGAVQVSGHAVIEVL